MPRPTCCRRVGRMPRCELFGPVGAASQSTDEATSADLEGMYQQQAARQMNISRQTFGRVIESARHKVALALCRGRALRIEGGAVEVVKMKRFQCSECRCAWEVPYGSGRPEKCPHCGGADIHRAEEDRGWARGGRGRGHGRGGGPGQGRQRGRCRRRGPGRVTTTPADATENQPAQASEGEQS